MPRIGPAVAPAARPQATLLGRLEKDTNRPIADMGPADLTRVMLDIRPFRSADLDALYAISLATGHEGGDASHLYKDGRLIGHIYAAPYALLEPDFALVVDDGRGVAGFALGTPDTDAWFRKLENEWWPHLRAIYEDPGDVPSPDWPADQRRAFMIHHPVPPPWQIAERYPAHLHLNLAPRIQGRGVGRLLFSEWMAGAAKRGVKAIHIGANRANPRAIEFWSRQGFTSLPDPDSGSARTAWMGRP
jgi:GNAT superfamily N-acetyltransferase